MSLKSLQRYTKFPIDARKFSEFSVESGKLKVKGTKKAQPCDCARRDL
jgi:hypothetical protein